ncbi:PAS domain-containing protein [Marinitoga aeolica]|uniref:PAS domain-containing protein n=1 Tax=Marinitoga aeolica TaxID=2809031 RepID=A0ABY8PPC0_9BACT|nr:PAS domain-containing protein [Marinitoga aeolica]WGS64388.1 PAS domain-containing protein [Marinitoga aeolica]
MENIILKNIFKKSENAIFYWDKNLKLIKANKKAAEILGYDSVDEMIGIPYEKHIDETDEEIIKKIKNALESGKIFEIFEKKYISKNNEILWVEAHLSPLQLKNGDFIIQEIDYDLTERKKLEENIELEKEKFKQYFELSQTINVVLDSEGNIYDINKKACETLKIAKEKAIGMNWFDNFIPEDIKENIKKVFIDMVDGRIKRAESYENEIITKDGEKRIISWKNSYIKENDEVIYVISSGIDITREKKYLERIEYENIFINEFFKLSNKLLNIENNVNIFQIIIDNLIEIIPHAQAGAFVLLNDQGKYVYKAMNGYEIKYFIDVRLKNEINDLNVLEPFLVENWSKEYKYPKNEKNIFEKYGRIHEIKETLYIPLTVK